MRKFDVSDNKLHYFQEKVDWLTSTFGESSSSTWYYISKTQEFTIEDEIAWLYVLRWT